MQLVALDVEAVTRLAKELTTRQASLNTPSPLLSLPHGFESQLRDLVHIHSRGIIRARFRY